ncbi:MAG: TIM barrel protein [Clostridia bacterium]|nr:TIM barrel protein [Clostridia bacterium]
MENNVTTENINYLRKFEELLINVKQDNVAVCLDLGHLLYGGLLEGNKNIFTELYNRKYLISRIREIHLHDYNIEKDHLIVGEGLLSLDKVVKFLKENNVYCPIIIENSVLNIEKAIEQVNKIRESIKEN